MIPARALNQGVGKCEMEGDQIGGASWIDGEIDGAGYGDARLGESLWRLMTRLDSAMGQPIPLVCEDWANTKAAYRFLSNA